MADSPHRDETDMSLSEGITSRGVAKPRLAWKAAEHHARFCRRQFLLPLKALYRGVMIPLLFF